MRDDLRARMLALLPDLADPQHSTDWPDFLLIFGDLVRWAADEHLSAHDRSRLADRFAEVVATVPAWQNEDPLDSWIPAKWRHHQRVACAIYDHLVGCPWPDTEWRRVTRSLGGEARLIQTFFLGGSDV